MTGSVEGRGVAAEQVPRHQHFEGTFFTVRVGLDALDRAFLHDVEVFGRIAFAENELTFPVTGFGQFVENSLTVLPAQDVEEWNLAELILGRNPGSATW